MFLEVSRLNVFYGDIQVLFDISFGIEKGEIISIIGSNVAGKSTTIKTVLGVLRAKSGSIMFDGNSIAKFALDKIVDLGIVQVPEGRELFPAMTVLENLEMGSFITRAKVKRADSLKKVFEIFPQIQKRTEQLAGTLSGGEQQMLAVARALMSCPRLLMLDEPFLGLGPIIVNEIFKIVKEINEDGTTVLLVEQNVHKALGISTRGYVLENGRIVLEGKGIELLNNENVRKAYLGI